PHCNRVIAGPSIRDDEKHDVSYFVQICDPCAGLKSCYKIDGVLVSDFTLRAYWARESGARAKCSFTGAVTKPRETLKDGYLTWYDPKTRHWWQKSWWDAKAEIKDLGAAAAPPPQVGEETTANITIVERRRLSIGFIIREHYKRVEPRKSQLK